MSSNSANEQSEDLSSTMTSREKDEMVGGFLTLIKADKKKLIDTEGPGILTCVLNAAHMASLCFPFSLPAAVTVDKTNLLFGFDLPLALGDYLRTLILYGLYALPTKDRRDQTVKSKEYTEEQEAYFWKLVRMALMLKGEELTPAQHFAAIADAMHRKFEGDAHICNSGYNNMDSHAKKINGGVTWKNLLAELGIKEKPKQKKREAKKQMIKA